ncbi:hypothetical protein [Saccharomonospora glauca]|uniref:hypothetical protein n=1 Tax=Saccharomonospora glauca TaxID=40990 RepID=UPI000312AEFF|nr:hypothetical protein [Saccharomonospora glauca]
MPLPGPDTHVVELRVPGLIGTSGDNLLDSTGTVDVAGDGIGRIIRPCDRLRRPAPGPVLRTPGRSVPRTLEGYLWSRMTSGGTTKAAWALLFPFSLVNVAQWMLPPASGSWVSKLLSVLCRALLRVAGLLLTMLLVGQLAVVTLDLLATQCLSPTAACLEDAPSWLRDTASVRTALGLTPLLALIGVLFLVASTSWQVRAPRLRKPLPDLPGGTMLDDEQETTTLRCLHTVAALDVVVLVLLGGPLTTPTGTVATVVWVLALVSLGFGVGAAALRANRLLGRVLRAGLLTLALVLVGMAAVVVTPLSARVSTGANATVELVAAALFAVCVVFALLLVPTAIMARRAWSALPRRLRPWAGGWAAAPTLALAALLGGGFGAGLAIAARYALEPSLTLPEGYTLITLLWGAGLVFAALVAVPVFAVAVPLRRARRGVPEVLRLMETREEDVDAAADAWARAAWERKHLHRIVLAVVMAMVVGAAALVVVRVSPLEVPDWLTPLSAVGVVALGGLAFALLRAVFVTATGALRVRHLAAFVDLVCFWPRVAHPVVPPSYALKVVPELAERAKEHLRVPDNRVVLAGYHVGGLLAVITASRLIEELSDAELERLGLLTAGTPLQWGYQRVFPSVFGHEALVRVFGDLGGRWRGLCRGTDTFGGGATTWRHQVTDGKLIGVGYLPEGGVGPLDAAEPGPHGTLVLGGDHWLPDPASSPVTGRRWAPGVRRHADYVVEPEWDRAVAYAAGLIGPTPESPQPSGLVPRDVLGTPRPEGDRVAERPN